MDSGLSLPAEISGDAVKEALVNILSSFICKKLSKLEVLTYNVPSKYDIFPISYFDKTCVSSGAFLLSS